jgi:hypothetical protein
MMKDLSLHFSIEAKYPFRGHFPLKEGILPPKNVDFF